MTTIERFFRSRAGRDSADGRRGCKLWKHFRGLLVPRPAPVPIYGGGPTGWPLRASCYREQISTELRTQGFREFCIPRITHPSHWLSRLWRNAGLSLKLFQVHGGRS